MADTDVHSIRERGRWLMIQGNYQEAAITFEEYLKKRKDDLEIQYLYTATKELKEPIKCNINFISVIELDIYFHIGVTAPLGSTLIDVLNNVKEACKETEEKIANRFRVSEDGEKLGGGFAMNWYVVGFKTIKLDMMTQTTEPERFFLKQIDNDNFKIVFSVPPKGFLEHEPTDFRVQFKESFSDPPLDKIDYRPEDSLSSVLVQFNTIVLLGPDVAPVWFDTAMTASNSVPELDIFFQRGRGPSDRYIEMMVDLLEKYAPSDNFRRMSRDELAMLVRRRHGGKGIEGEIEERARWSVVQNAMQRHQRDMNHVERTLVNRCPDCNAEVSDAEVRPDGYVICKKCRKRFKS